MKISVIIPIYNSQYFLNQCFDSLINQTSQNFELIVINDGSTDNSLKICKHYSKKFKNYKILEQSNQGVSSARNLGLKHSSGSYIYFMDSDDYVSENFIESINENLKINNPDLILFGFSRVNYLGNEKSKIIPQENQIIDLNLNFNSEKLFYVLNQGIGLTIWDKVIKKSLLTNNKILFRKMTNAEDFVFCIEIYSKAKIINVLKQAFYNYRVQISGKRNNNYDLPQNHIIAMEKLLEFIKSFKQNSEAIKFVTKSAILWFAIVNPLNIKLFNKIRYKDKKYLLKQVYNWPGYKEMLIEINSHHLNSFEKFSWFIFLQQKPLLSLLFGHFLNFARKIKYKQF